ncbi:histone methyltransferases(H3-K4 specific) [Raphanus sativus]|nr:histone methyltransferases(H3-K4 specific) [Raphanus sativus]
MEEEDVEQMRDGNSVGKDEDEEKSDAVCCVDKESQKPGVVSEEARGSVSDAIVPGGTVLLPIGVNETGTEADSVEKFESLGNAKEIDNDDGGGEGDGFNCTFGGGGKEGGSDAGFSDDVSLIRSCPFPDSVLDSGGFGCSETENHMKSSGDIDGNMPLAVSPSLAVPEMFSNNDGGPRSHDLDDVVDTETINPDLRLVHDDELHTDLSEKNETLLKNHVGNSSSESDVAALRMNNDVAADPRAQNFSRISPLEENTFGVEANAPITDPSLVRSFPLKFGNGGTGARNPENAVDSIRIVDGNGRIGGEVASASGTSESSPQRRSRAGKQGNISQTKRSAPHPRKSSRKKQSERNLESIFNCSKQKRSSVSKPDRSSQWGLPCRTAEIFLQSNNIPYRRPPQHEAKQPQNNPKNGEHNSSNNGYVEGPSRNIQASSGSCLLSKVSGNSLPAGGSVKAGTGLEFPGPADVVEDKLQTGKTREQLKEKNNPVEKLSCRLSPDSITDEKKNQDAEGVREGTGTRSLDAETSPDSEVINSVPDSTVSNGLKEDLPHVFFSTAEDMVNTNRGLEKQDELLASASPLENGSHLIPNAKKVLFLDANIGKTINGGAITQDVIHEETVMELTIEDSSSTESAWVRCDDCFKWRRIPASVVESIDESSKWICMNNSDKDFAHCSISQEMSNEEINEELGIGQDEADAYDYEAANRGNDKEQKSKRLPGNKKACFRAIKTNQFLHRNRKNQTIDEIMVCHCKPPPDGRLGLEKNVSIECLTLNVSMVPALLAIYAQISRCDVLFASKSITFTFQKRKYVKFERFQSGKKGYGLRLLEDVREGQFLIEYVGEVLDMQSYEARQKDYASMGQKHFYFMTLNGNEVIDAGAKGNLGRFINHSCEPNCRTEKWMVNGEICVGIFSMQDLKKGQELTFDYNYVRVFGAAAKKCYCGSSHCRGYIGGDPLNGDVVVQSDSDEEYPELVILDDDESGEGILDATPRIFIDSSDMQMPPQKSEMVDDSKDLTSQSPSSLSVKLPESEIPPSFQPTEVPKELSTDMPVIDVQQEVLLEKKTKNTSPTTSSPSRVSSDGANANKTVKQGSGENKKILSRSRPRMKTSRSSGSSKQDKSTLPGVNKAQTTPVKKLQQQPIKSKGSEEVSPSGLEGKLNELLDVGGGISKRRDSAKGYLKLLLLTAASRGSANEGIQSNRDLSMILDALLKTKSRTVLVDIINKNGLQMLHNIMKQYRRDFKKTPILRKLLKVLEYLATRDILALEHIVRPPPYAGMESFKESILTLTEHDDKQVHQIARNFRDRWIPKHFRKPWRMDREDRSESRRSPINSRFRASQEPRYDHHSPRRAEPFTSVISSRAATPETPSVSDGCIQPPTSSSLPETNGRKRKSRWDQPSTSKEQRTMTDVQDDLPPGFTSPCPDAPNAVTAQPQAKFLSRLTVSYGIPLSIVHQCGSPCKDDPNSWSVAPGIPFSPFPPLPPVPHGEFFAKRNGTVCPSSMGNPGCSSEIKHSGWNISGATGTVSASPNRKREFSSDIGTSYFRQQKQNVPPWMRNNNGWEKTANIPIPEASNFREEDQQPRKS